MIIIKFYEFRYRSKSAQITAGVLNVLGCLIYPPVITVLFILILRFFKITDYLANWSIIGLLIISLILGIIFVIKYSIGYKGVMICNDYIEIERNYVTDRHPIPNFKIYYKDIKYIYNSKQPIGLHTIKARKALVSGGDLSYYVEIVLNGGKEFFIPVENQDDFFNELINRINIYRKRNNLKEL